MGKASHNKKLGISCICLLPMMFSVWQDSTGNSLYSYGALVQSTLLPALVAGLAVLRLQDTGHKRWAVLAGYCAFQCCATFEIGFTYIVPIFGLAWLYTGKARDALRLSIPVFVGECVTLAFNMGARLMNTLRAAGILAGSVSQIEGISPNFDLPAILRTWAMQMSAGFPLNAMVFGKIKPTNVQISDVIFGVALAACKSLLKRASWDGDSIFLPNWQMPPTGYCCSVSRMASVTWVTPSALRSSMVSWERVKSRASGRTMKS